MPNISSMKASKFLKREDAGKGIMVTILEVTQENIAKEGAPEELKWCAHFKETDKPMVLNWTNLQLIAQISGEENSDDWGGVKIVLFDDPNVSFQGKLIGGLRVRAPKKGAKLAEPEPEELDDDSVPF